MAIKKFVVRSFRGLSGNFETKNWRIASKFGMGIANTGIHYIFRFLKIQNTFFEGFFDVWFFENFGVKNWILEILDSDFLALAACCFTYTLAFSRDLL